MPDTRPVADGSPPRRPRARRWVLGVTAGLAAVLAAAAVLALQHGTSPPKGALLYSDDFGDRGNWDGYTFSPDAEGDNRTVHGYEIDRGVYSLMADQTYPNDPALSPVPAKDPAAVERDTVIEATAQLREGSTGRGGFGLLCRWDEDVPNGYTFLLGLDGTARVVRTAGGIELDVTPPVHADPPRAGRKVRLQAACQDDGGGTRLTLWIDGDATIDTVDSQALPAGPSSQAGLVARVPEAGGGAVTVSFDDFSVYRTR